MPEPLGDLHVSMTGDLAGVVSEAEKAISDLNSATGAELMPLARLLLRTESVASSKVEGMQIDARRLARAEANQETGRRVGTQAAEILANIDAMQLAVERASTTDALGTTDLLEIHRVLMERAPNSHIAGKLRNSQNWIGGNDYNPCGADFVPPPHEDMDRLLGDLGEFLNDDALPPLVQAAIAHAQFETIHPFEDGNGRTGRALIQVLLRRRGLAPAFVPPISVVLAREKNRYLKGLTAFREDRVGEWLEIFATATARAAKLATQYAEYVRALQQKWRSNLSGAGKPPRAGAAAWLLVSLLPAHPIVTIAVAVAATQRTRPAIANAITELEAAGVLTRLTESQRNRAWEAEGLLDLIVGLESGARLN